MYWEMMIGLGGLAVVGLDLVAEAAIYPEAQQHINEATIGGAVAAVIGLGALALTLGARFLLRTFQSRQR